MLPLVFSWVHPRSVVDVGCGVGTWLGEAARLGIEDFLGVDGDYVDRAMLEIPAERFVPRDLCEPFDLGRRFDLVMSVEVAEHLPLAHADRFVEALTSLGAVVLFSAAIPGQGGEHHVNEDWPQAWARRFAKHGYRWADPLRLATWNDERVDPWYAQNLLVFHRPDAFATPPWPAGTPTGGAVAGDGAASGSADGTWPLALVHPVVYRRIALRKPTIRRAWKMFRRALRARFPRGGGK